MSCCRSPVTLVLLVFTLLLTSCSSRQRELKLLAGGDLESVPPQVLLANLQAMDRPERDRVPHLLDLGALKMVCGDPRGAVFDLSQANAAMAAFRAPSITETLGAVTLSETLRSYPGSPTEQVMVHTMAALAYLMQGNRSNARVEVLQADVKMRQLATAGGINGQLAGARFLGGVVFELGGEWDDALISYRKAFKLLEARGEPVPRALGASLLQLTKRMGLADEHQGYKARFPHLTPRQPSASELFIIYLDGVISPKQEQVIKLFSPELDQRIKIALPKYPPSDYRVSPLTVQLTDGVVRSEVIEDLESRVREDLQREMPAIMARTLARAVARYHAVDEAWAVSEILGAAAGIFLNSLEEADTRSWDMLPSSIQVARVAVNGHPVMLRGGRLGTQTLPPLAGKAQLVIVSSLSPTIYPYPGP